MEIRARVQADSIYYASLSGELNATLATALRRGSEAHCHFGREQCQSLVEHWDAERCTLFRNMLNAQWRELSHWYLHNMRSALRARLAVLCS